jgi:hypothetical protein
MFIDEGILPSFVALQRASVCLPHARGGVSLYLGAGTGAETSSPRPWGCFWRRRACSWRRLVFPTPVGVFLHLLRSLLRRNCLPHARGGVSSRRSIGPPSAQSSPRPWGVSNEFDRLVGAFESSPRPWGCFSEISRWAYPSAVFPTPVGVFPASGPVNRKPKRLPHARGGVSVDG